MSTSFNPECKFRDGQKVRVISGFHTGKTGTIVSVDLLENPRRGNINPENYAGKGSEFNYEVNLGFLFTPIYCFESQMESI